MILEIFQYAFIQRAILTGICVAIACAVMGVFLVLRRLSLIGDGLAHTSFGGVALGLALGFTPMIVAIPVSLIGSIIIVRLMRGARLYGDAAIGIVSAAGISIGVMLASIGGGFNADLLSYLFGNILSVTSWQAFTSIVMTILVLAIVFAWKKALFAMTFDEQYAKTLGIKTEWIEMAFFLLTSLIVVFAIQVVGVLLVSALLILPASSSLQLQMNFNQTLVIAIAVAISSVVAGIIASIVLNMPTGAMIVIVNLLLFLIARISRRFVS